MVTVGTAELTQIQQKYDRYCPKILERCEKEDEKDENRKEHKTENIEGNKM
jgi:hypothetical protein